MKPPKTLLVFRSMGEWEKCAIFPLWGKRCLGLLLLWQGGKVGVAWGWGWGGGVAGGVEKGREEGIETCAHKICVVGLATPVVSLLLCSVAL